MIGIVLYIGISTTCMIYTFRPGYTGFDIENHYTRKVKSSLRPAKKAFMYGNMLCPCIYQLHSLVEMMVVFFLRGHMTTHVYSFRGGSTFPQVHLTAFSPFQFESYV